MSTILKRPVAHECFVVQNVHCARCADTLERTLSTTPGVVSAHVDAMLGRTHVDYFPDELSGDELLQGIEAGGFEILTTGATDAEDN